MPRMIHLLSKLNASFSKSLHRAWDKQTGEIRIANTEARGKQKPSIISRPFRTRSWFRHIAASYKAPRYNTGSLFWSSILSEMSPGQPQPGGSSNPRCVTSSPRGLVLRPAARGTLGTGRGVASCSGRSVVARSFVCFYDFI